MPRHVLVTGCSSGIGLATALHLARSGEHVFAACRRPDAAEALQAAIAEGLPIDPIAMDVRDDASVSAGLAAAHARAPAIDVLVNNAGVSRAGAIETSSLDVARDIMETNYLGALRLTRALLPQMRERRTGTIVNISSQAGRRPFALLGYYCASKHALSVASEVLAHEVAPFGIRIALIEPGVIDTPIFRKAPAPERSGPYAPLAEALANEVSRDLAEGSRPEEVAALVHHAITTDAPRLHYLVGAGAERNVSEYATMGPDGFVRAGARPNPDD